MLARADDPTDDFTTLSPSELGGLDVHALAQARSQPSTAYAFEVAQGLFISDDGGDSWQLVAPVGRDVGSDVTALAVHPTDPEPLLMGGGQRPPAFHRRWRELRAGHRRRHAWQEVARA